MSRKMELITLDFTQGTVTARLEGGETAVHPQGSPEAFELLSRAWLRASWDVKYVYSFTWLGRPIIQLPEDMFRLQEVIYTVQPDVIIETGVAHGGSLVFYAGLCRLMGKGRVVGIDIEIRPHNRRAIEAHALSPSITLVEGGSTDPRVVQQVSGLVRPGEKAMVFLDSCHSKDHVLAELRAYAPLVSKGSYIVAMDGIMEEVVGAPRTRPDWTWNNPIQAVKQFLQENSDFVMEEPPFRFNEGAVRERITYWPSAFLKRVR
jgi:cephalosporin hydroxylase